MTEDTMPAPAKGSVPWHLWVVGVVALLWNGFGGYDYVMTRLQGDAYMRSAGMTDAQIAHFNAMPVWMEAVWAIGVWGGVLGSILLLLRSKWAFHALLASLIAFAMSVVYGQTTGGNAVMGSMGLIFSGVIFLIGLALVMYARAMTKRGVLR